MSVGSLSKSLLEQKAGMKRNSGATGILKDKQLTAQKAWTIVKGSE